MTQIEANYAIVLYEIGVPREIVEQTESLYGKTPELKKALASPIIDKEAKHRVIDRIFPSEVHNFLKVVCDYQSIDSLEQIFTAYYDYYNEKHGIVTAFLYYYDEPTEKEVQAFNRYLVKQYHKKVAHLHMAERKELLGGFVLRVKDYEIDWSMKERLSQLKQILVRR